MFYMVGVKLRLGRVVKVLWWSGFEKRRARRGEGGGYVHHLRATSWNGREGGTTMEGGTS